MVIPNERLREVNVSEARLGCQLDVCGWPVVPDDEPGCWASNCSMRPAPQGRADSVASYSTDPATIPNMLAWFDGQGIELVIGSNPKATDWTKWDAEALPNPPGQCCRAHGATLTEALARLVVAARKESTNG